MSCHFCSFSSKSARMMVIFVPLLLFFKISSSFKTSTCHHEAIDSALVGFYNCINYDNYDYYDEDDKCEMFTPGKQCETKEIGGCFENDDLEQIKDQRFSWIREEYLQIGLFVPGDVYYDDR